MGGDAPAPNRHDGWLAHRLTGAEPRRPERRLAAMTTHRSPLLLVLAVALVLAACSAPVPSPPAGGTAPPSSGPSGGSAADAVLPPDNPVGGVPGGGDPGNGGVGQPKFVVPRPGQLNVHPVAIEQLIAKVEGRHVVLNARWWSGVEPCAVLDSVAVKQDGATFTVSVREGSADADAVCIEIAELKVTAIDLGELSPGVYTIAADQGPAPPISVTVA